MSYNKDDFLGVWAVDEAARQALHNAANNRGQKCFNAIAQFGSVTAAPPLSWEDQIQSYTLATIADVDTFLNYPGVAIRGYEFLVELAKYPGGAPDQPSIEEVDNVYTATGTWPGGTVLTFTIDITDPDGQTEQDVVPITLPPGQHSGTTVATYCAAVMDPLVHIRADAVANTLTLSAAAPANTLASSVAVS